MPTITDAAIRHLQHTLDVPDPGERYEILGEIGRGGMGVVYRARDRALRRDVALKVHAFELSERESPAAEMRPREGSAHASDSAVMRPAVMARLTREARVLARLEHPGIVAVHDVGVLADGRPYYVMRLVRGTNLSRHAPALGRGERLRLFLQVCDAVAFAHARGIIHRDLTPGNVMIGEYGEVLVVDWGVARILDDAPVMPASAATTTSATAAVPGRTGDGVVVGTPGFMPPEQATGATRDADERSDVFGLGAILRALLAHDDTPLPRPLRAVVARSTAGAPGDRYASVTALAADVRHWLDDQPVSAYRESLVERARRFYVRNRPLILLLLAYAIVRVVILLWRGM